MTVRIITPIYFVLIVSFLFFISKAAFSHSPSSLPINTRRAPATAVLADTTRPKIFGITINELTSSSVRISWRTDEKADTEVEYGLTKNYGLLSSYDANLLTSHTMRLINLLPDSTYHFRVLSRDAAGNLAASRDSTFITPMRAAALYSPFEVTLIIERNYHIPYVEVAVTGVFTSPTGKELRLQGFWDGGEIWKIRFSPNEIGVWKYRTESNEPDLITAGRFLATPTKRRGFVRVSKTRPDGFEYSDGTPFLLMGDTIWDGMTAGVGLEARFKPYINLRASQHFNAYHTIVVNNRYDYQANEGGPPYAMFSPEVRDYNRLNPDYFKWVDKRVAYADSMGMVSILFFTWAHEVAKMTTEDYQRLALYIVSRYAAYNVFWILAGDYQAYHNVPALYRQIGKAVAAADPYDHPISIHPQDDFVNREFAQESWLSYVMQQLRDDGEFLADSIRLDRIYNKPVVNGEYGYHVPESVHPHHGIRNDAKYIRTGGWSIFAAGGYFVAGFGGTFFDPDGHYGYDPGYDHPPLRWNLHDTRDEEMARQYGVFYRFFREQTNWTALAPHPEMVADEQTEMLANPGGEYIAYKAHGDRMRLRLPPGQSFALSWFNPITGAVDSPHNFRATAETVLLMPSDTMDAVAILRPSTTTALLPAGEVSGLQSEQLNIRQVRFRWVTPQAADSRIEVQRPSGSQTQFIDATYTTQHEMIVDGLFPDLRYKITVSSQTPGNREWKTVAQCVLTNVVVVDRYIEAESMAVRTVGHAEPPGWNLDETGYLATSMNFPQSGPYRLEILARGEYRQKNWPQLLLEIDNVKRDTLSINSAVFKWFGWNRDVIAGVRTIKLSFINAGNDRQLILDQLHVQFLGVPATAAPVIKNVDVSNLTPTTATVNWKTDKPAAAEIEYGLSTNYNLLTPAEFCRDTLHALALTGLKPKTTYHFRIRAKDAAGKVALSRDTTFTTLSAIERLVIVSGEGQNGKPEKLLTAPLVIKVFDAAGKPSPNVAVAFRVLSGGGKLVGANNCSSQECVSMTAADGTASVQWQMGRIELQKVEVRPVERQDLMVQFNAKVDITAVEVENRDAVPLELALQQRPNPFHDFTQFDIALPDAGHVTLKIFDLQGREVITLVDAVKSTGRFFMPWNGRDQKQRAVAAGTYLAVLRYAPAAESSGKVFVKKTQLLFLK